MEEKKRERGQQLTLREVGRPKVYTRVDPKFLDNVPDRLRQFPQWVCWRIFQKENDYPSKMPINPNSGFEASTNRPHTWGTFEQAVARFRSDTSLHGVGFVFTEEDPFTGIDIDDCRDKKTGVVAPWADAVIEGMDSYTEASPSGTGVRILIEAKSPGQAKRRNKFEIYFSGQYLTITGQVLGAILPIEQRQHKLNDLYAMVFGADLKRKERKPVHPAIDAKLRRVQKISDDDLLAKMTAAANGAKFLRLWEGGLDDHAGDHSRADLALCAILTYWTRADAPRVDALFRRSKLVRKKWDERHGRQTYGEMTIDQAISAEGPLYDPDTEAEALTRNDIGNSEVFVQIAGDDFRWCYPWKMWLHWTGVSWERDAEANLRQAVETVPIELLRRASLLPVDQSKADRKWALDAGQFSRLSAIDQLARYKLVARMERFDSDPFLIACLNGVVDLRDGKLRDGRKDDWITRWTNVAFLPDERCPQFDKFLLEVMEGDAGMTAYLWRVLGYCLTGDTSERAFFLLHGVGRNGKTTFVEVLHALLDGYAQTARFNTFLRKPQISNGANDDVAHLVGARVVMASEADDSATLDAAVIKTLTGSDTIRARFLYGREFEFKPAFKLFLVTNHVPKIQESSHALWDRLHRIPFNYRVPEKKMDKRLPLRLLGELEGIFARAVLACLEWQKEGLAPPDKVIKANAELKERMDVLGQFITDCVERGEFKQQHGELYDEYARWSKINGMRYPVTSRTLANYMREQGFNSYRGRGNAVTWLGLRLRGQQGEIL